MRLYACLTEFLIFTVCSAAEFKLSDSKLLLPYFSTASVNYTLSGSAGSCYEWWSGTPEVVAVVPIGDFGKTCTEKASVTAVWQSSFRRTATVYARDTVTAHVLKCDVIVDDIHSIKVDTTTQELYLHNTPESLEVIAYDEFGNKFSSLDGIPFEWKIYPGSEKDSKVMGHGVLRFLSWTESEYTTSGRISILESDGMQGYMQLVSGLRTGSAVVSAALREPAYSHVNPAMVRLLVMANAQLNPPVLYLIPKAQAHLQVIVVRQDADEEIKMPSNQYYLSVSDESIVELDTKSGSLISAEGNGQTTVTLLDKNVEEAISLLGSNVGDAIDLEPQMVAHHRRPMSIVNVVEPAYFRFSVQPVGEDALLCIKAARQSSQAFGQGKFNHWTLETGKKYNLQLDLYDQNNHRIFPSDNLRISVEFPKDSLEALRSSKNGTSHIVVARKVGMITVKATLEGVMTGNVKLKLFSHPIMGSQELAAYSPIQIYPNQVNLAWDISMNTSEGFNLSAKGGSGDYIWTVLPGKGTKDVSAVNVSQDGVLFVKEVGSAVVVVSDLRNPAMCSHSTVHVNHLADLGFSQGRVEIYLPKNPLGESENRLSSVLSTRPIELDVFDLLPYSHQFDQHPFNQQEKMGNSVLSVGLKAVDFDGNPITFCHNLPIRVRPVDPSLAKVLPGIQYLPPSVISERNLSACAFVRVIGLREGFTELEAYFTTGEQKGEQKAISKFPIVVYKDISFLPNSAFVAIATGSSRRISFTDGPNPWELDITSHFVELEFIEAPMGKKNPSIHQKPQAFTFQGNTSLSGFTFVLHCESSGNFEVSVIVGNRPSSTNPLPAVLSTPLSVICDIPSKIELLPHLDLPTLPKGFPVCPIVNRSFGSSDDFIPFSNNAPLNVEVVIKGFSGLELSGVDSIEMSTHITIGNRDKAENLVTDYHPEILGSKQAGDSIVPTRPHFIITPRTLGESAGLMHVQVTAKHTGEQTTDLESLLNLKMAPKVVIEPLNDFQLLLHPNASTNVHLSHGSGFFHFEIISSSKGVGQACLSVDELKSQRDFVLHPKCKGKVTLRATDLCFLAEPVYEHESAIIAPAYDERVVSVVGLGSLRLYAPSQMEVNSKASVYIRAFDSEGTTLSAQFVNLLDLQVTAASPEGDQSVAFTCQDSSDTSKGSYWLSRPSNGNLPGLAKVTICSQALGLSKLKAVSGFVTSNIEPVNVYAPLSLIPCDLNLLLGAAHQITISGGPSLRSLSFEVSTERPGQPKLSFTEVGEDGDGILLRAELGKVGSASVSVKTTSSSGYTGLDIGDFEAWGLTPPPKSLYSRAFCHVNVVALSGIRIGCPLPLTSSGGGSEVRILVASPAGNTSLGGVPIWAEGIAMLGGNELTVTPMGMADVRPPLHFAWRLSPPMPNAPAQLFHWLSKLNVDPDDTTLSSGMVLVGVTPGQVKLHLTVFTDGEALMGQLTSHPTSRSSHPVKQLSAEITFTIIPHLSLISPPHQNPLILVSPNSRLQLTLPQHILLEGVVEYSIQCPSNSPTNMLRVSSTGQLEAGSHDRCGVWSEWRLNACRCRLRIDYRSVIAGGTERNERSHQSLALDVIIKPPHYVLSRALSGPTGLLKSNGGLPFGGPYPVSLSLHDEVGETFDAVSESLLSLQLQAHRSNLLDFSIDSNAGQIGGQLLLRLTPPLHASIDSQTQSATILKMTHGASTQLAPSYLTIPIGPLLTINGVSEFTVGQWACLPPLPQGDGVWSSSDPTLLWIDNASKFILPLRAGNVHLQFTPKASKIALLGKLTLASVCSKFSEDVQVKSSTMPVGLESAQEVAIHVKLASKTASATDSSCSSGLMLSHLSAVSPLTCSARLELGGSNGESQQWAILPNWLRGFLLAERIARAANVVVDSDLALISDLAVAQSSDFNTEMIPSPNEAGSWTCSVRSSEPSEYYRLAILPSNSRLIVEIKGNCGNSADEVISRSELLLMPAFRLIVPSLHLGSPEPILLTSRSPKADLLIFIPPATLDQMGMDGSNERGLKARSQRPDLLAISYAPQPVTSTKVVKAAIERMVRETGSTSNWGNLFRNLSLMMENEAQASHEQALGNGIFWSVGIKTLPTKTATDAVVEVVLSLKVTGQHVTVPIRVQTRSAHAGEIGSEADYEEDSDSGGFWVNLPWLHLLLLIFLTILLIVASQVVTRSLTGAGFGSTAQQKGLPPIPNGGGASPFAGPAPRLWSQGFGEPGSGLIAGGMSGFSPSLNPRLSNSQSNNSPFGDNLGLFAGDTPARFRGSPSRLREAFDNSL
nr:nuclear pore membrane glycoprotein 210 [Hymenolepis microstoma]